MYNYTYKVMTFFFILLPLQDWCDLSPVFHIINRGYHHSPRPRHLSNLYYLDDREVIYRQIDR